jgi:Fe-S cluster assembly ATP-binding protein
MALLEIRGLVACKGERKVLDGLHLEVAAGEVHALVGTNGTGKTTLAATIMGCRGYRIAAGSLRFAGRDLAPLSLTERARLGIAMAWQEPVRFEGLTVARYLALRPGPRSPEEALAMVGLAPEHYLERLVDGGLSGGERKRVELASLLTLPLQLVLLDEPDSGIDLLSTRGIVEVIDAFRAAGTAVLLITHREEIARIADVASQLCFGRIVFSGPPDAVADHYLGRKCVVCDGRECGHERA